MKEAKIKICKLPLSQRNTEGAYWAKVNGENIGVEGRAFFETESAARLAAYAYIHGVQPLADLLGVGKDWVYRRLNGQMPIKRKDERLMKGLEDTLEPQESMTTS